VIVIVIVKTSAHSGGLQVTEPANGHARTWLSCARLYRSLVFEYLCIYININIKI